MGMKFSALTNHVGTQKRLGAGPNPQTNEGWMAHTATWNHGNDIKYPEDWTFAQKRCVIKVFFNKKGSTQTSFRL